MISGQSFDRRWYQEMRRNIVARYEGNCQRLASLKKAKKDKSELQRLLDAVSVVNRKREKAEDGTLTVGLLNDVWTMATKNANKGFAFVQSKE